MGHLGRPAVGRLGTGSILASLLKKNDGWFLKRNKVPGNLPHITSDFLALPAAMWAILLHLLQCTVCWKHLSFPKPVVIFLLYLITVAAFYHEIDLCKSFTENITDMLAFYGAST